MTQIPPELSDVERALIAQARRIVPPNATERSAGWRRLAQTADRPRPRAWLAPAWAAAAALVLVGVLRVAYPPSPARQPPLAVAPREAPKPTAPSPAATPALAATTGPRWSVRTLGEGPVPAATVRIQEGAKVKLTSDSRIDLDDGLVCAEVAHRDLPRQGPLIVATPQVAVTVIGTRFCVEVAAGESTVSVQEGRVRVQNPAGALAFVGAGESIRSTELVPSRATGRAPKPAAPTCPVGGPLQPREACLDGIARGTGLAAQNALFALGLLARDEGHDGPSAVSYFHSYLGRFPDSPLAPEASLASVAELRAEQRDGEALTEADRYLSRYAQAGRADEVELLRANLLRERLHRPQDALAGYEHVAATSGRPALRDEAAFGKALALLALGQVDAAHEALDAYLRVFPGGAHAAEATRLAR